MKADRPGIEPATCKLQVQRSTAKPPRSTSTDKELITAAPCTGRRLDRVSRCPCETAPLVTPVSEPW